MKELSKDVRVFQHETLPGALAALKSELGDDAFIVRTRQIEKRGFFGMKGKPLFEIQACPSSDAVAKKDKPGNGAFQKAYQLTGPKLHPLEGQVKTPKKNHRDLEDLSKEIQSMKTMLKEIVFRSREKDDLAGLSDEIQNLHTHLIHLGVRESRARSLVKELNHDLNGESLKNPRRLREELRKRLIDRIPTMTSLSAGQEKARIAAFIGPTGVGKTTTVSKLAGYFNHYEQLDVALMTIDTYRIAATEQLHRVAEIVDVPIRSETSPVGLKKAIDDYNNKDLILIDTAGRSQRDMLQMNELKKFLEAAKPDDVFLVLPVNQDVQCLEQVIEKFGPLANRLILSKLDEATRLGPLVDLLLNNDLPVTYWTFGQSIPDDIAAVNANRLAKLLLGEESL